LFDELYPNSPVQDAQVSIEYDARVPLVAVAVGPDAYVAIGRDRDKRLTSLILVPKSRVASVKE
jgi:hypothetical protein